MMTVKTDSSFSSYLEIFQGVPQSILGLLIFNLFFCDLFLFVLGSWYYELCRWQNSECVFGKCWHHTRKTRGNRKSTFEIVFKQFCKAKCWQMSSYIKKNKQLLKINLNNRLGFSIHNKYLKSSGQEISCFSKNFTIHEYS